MTLVYRHIRLDKNEPFYIGVGTKHRAKTHHERNNLWNKIVAKTDWEVEILFDDLSWEKAVEKEMEFISLYGRINNGTGTLANMTDGGGGAPGVVWSKERRKRRAKRYSGGNNPKARRVYCSHLNKEFDTISECANALGVSQPYLSRMVLGKRTNKYGVFKT